MPPACAATARNHACTRVSERKTINRAASVPVDQRENSRLESLRSKKPKLGTENLPSSSLPSVVVARTCERNPPFCATSKADRIADTSASVVKQTTENSEQRPQKKRKRSLSTPPAPWPSQLFTQLRSCRRRSRLDSPTADVECLPPSRVSARLARKAQSFMINRGPDIYTHLASLDGVGSLLNEPPGSSIISSALNDTVGPQPTSTKRSRGRQRKVPDLTDQDAKRDLIEEWARMRQSQGTLSFSSINQDACFSQTLSHENRNGEGSIPSLQPGTMIQRSSFNTDLVNQTTDGTGASRSKETGLDVSCSDSSSTQTESKNPLSMGVDVPGNKLDHDSVIPSDGKAEQFISPNSGVEVPSKPIPDSHIDEDTSVSRPTDDLEVAQHLKLPQCFEHSPLSLSSSPREGSIHTGHARLLKSPVNEQVEFGLPAHDHPATISSTYPLDAGDMYLDFDEEFYMLGIPELFTSPWVPVSSHLYVPPGLGKLISGMKEQLVMEARARRRAEELYQAELRRRIVADKTVEDLRTKLKLEGETGRLG